MSFAWIFTLIVWLPPPSWLLGIIVPALSGRNNSGPASPTRLALPTGGLPPFSNPFILFTIPIPTATAPAAAAILNGNGIEAKVFNAPW